MLSVVKYARRKEGHVSIQVAVPPTYNTSSWCPQQIQYAAEPEQVLLPHCDHCRSKAAIAAPNAWVVNP